MSPACTAACCCCNDLCYAERFISISVETQQPATAVVHVYTLTNDKRKDVVEVSIYAKGNHRCLIGLENIRVVRLVKVFELCSIQMHIHCCSWAEPVAEKNRSFDSNYYAVVFNTFICYLLVSSAGGAICTGTKKAQKPRGMTMHGVYKSIDRDGARTYDSEQPTSPLRTYRSGVRRHRDSSKLYSRWTRCTCETMKHHTWWDF